MNWARFRFINNFIVNVGVRAFAQNALRNFSYFFFLLQSESALCVRAYVRVSEYFCAFMTNNCFRNAMVVKMWFPHYMCDV